MALKSIAFILILSWCGFSLGARLSDWLIYTNDDKNAFCLLSNLRYYCLPITNKTFVNQTSASCTTNGKLWTFSTLQVKNITTDDLIDWIIPFDIIENYAQYLNFSISGNHAICNCSKTYLGVNCEYRLRSDIFNVHQIITQQLGGNRDRDEEQPTSLVDGITCNTEALHLEWRQICDGIINCADATDEWNCHLLELNTCESDEFQCRNGMCIPKEFLFDTEFDCMDSSDEQELSHLYEEYTKCPRKSGIECDERLCQRDQFSCGNGQCVHWSAVIDHVDSCENSRDSAYLCETIDYLVERRNGLAGICRHTMIPLLELTNTSNCVVSLRHLLFANKARRLNETRQLALNNIKQGCEELIQYPERSVLSPVLKMFYKKSLITAFYDNQQNFEQPIPRKPHLVCFSGSMMCNGILLTLQKDDCMSHDQFEQLVSYPFFPIPHLFCQVAAGQTPTASVTLVQSNTGRQSSLSLTYTCLNTSVHLSIRRINDGYIDCLYRDDEKNSFHAMKQPYRYRCQTTSPWPQYVSVQQLGNGINECTDGSDEISHELRWTSLKCSIHDSYACWVFQGDLFKEDRIHDVRLAFHRHCDSVWDTMDGRDERNCSQWICLDRMVQCNRTGQCMFKTDICDGEFDCDDGEDELNCVRQSSFLEFDCDRSNEHFCIPSQYLQNRTFNRPCISYERVGDGKIDCAGGRDERNVFSCSDHLMLGDRFLCDNQTKCVDYTVLCNGVYDCLDQTDEIICFWNRDRCAMKRLAGVNDPKCNDSRYNPTKNCSNGTNWFWHSSSTTISLAYRSSKQSRTPSYAQICYSGFTDRLMSAMIKSTSLSLNNPSVPVSSVFGLCNRGFYLIIDTGKRFVCFCPPSFYGEQCQFDSRRVIVRVRFDRRHRSDIPSVLNVLVLLLFNNSVIFDHQTFVDIDQDFPLKHDVYLLYPYRKPHGTYSIRFEAYHSIDLLAAWEYPISPLDFLPSLRIAKILRFPDRTLPWLNPTNQCKNNGTSYYMNNDQHFCVCQRGWEGVLCESKLVDVKCASHSFSRHRHICICPYGYLPPHCFVRNTICEKSNQCSSNEICYPLSTHPPNQYTCQCNNSLCAAEQLWISIQRNQSNQAPFLLQLLKITTDHSHVRQQILVPPSTNFPIAHAIKIYHKRYMHNSMAEVGLLFTFHATKYSVDTAIHLLFINCSNNFYNYSIDLDIQPQRCQSLSDIDRQSVKLFHKFCQHPDSNPCFVSAGYICYCSLKAENRMECLSYHQRDISCAHCYNHGYCIQGDLRNITNFLCVCPKCASGKLCQYSPSRFSVSLEFLIEKTNWGVYHFVIPVILMIFGAVLNGISTITFSKLKSRQTGSGFYLLINSITSQVIVILLFTRTVYLYLMRQVTIQQTVNVGLCKSLPFLMSSLNYISLWLMAIVTVERVLLVAFPFRSAFLSTQTLAVFVTVVVFSSIFASNYIYFHQYKIVRHPDDVYPWCISEIQQNQEQLVQYTSLAHRISPFMVNLIAGLTIILVVSRSKANSQHLSTSVSLAKQTRERFDLLLAPVICFITQLPQLIIIFLDACDYNQSSWFVHLTFLAYYVSFVPQMSLFFLYIQPSPLFKEVFIKDTAVGKRVTAMIRRH